MSKVDLGELVTVTLLQEKLSEISSDFNNVTAYSENNEQYVNIKLSKSQSDSLKEKYPDIFK